MPDTPEIEMVHSEYHNRDIPKEEAVHSIRMGDYILYEEAVQTNDQDYTTPDRAVELIDGSHTDEDDQSLYRDPNGNSMNRYVDGYFRCECCDCIKNEDDMYTYNGDELCGSCYNNREEDSDTRLHDYGYTPDLDFYIKSDDSVTYGIELEYDYAQDNEDLVQNQYFFYAKEDGSLDEGAEFVSHPFDFEWYQENKQKLKNFILSIDGKTSNTTGLHIHIGRKNITENQIENICNFISENEINRYILSGRTASSYGKIHKKEKGKTKKDLIKDYGSIRYSAVNLTNSATIEIRTYRCSRLPHHILGRIELTHCLVEWCEKNGTNFKKFTKFCKEKNLDNLNKLLKEKGF